MAIKIPKSDQQTSAEPLLASSQRTPSERWRSQQKTALAKLARSEALDQQVEEFAEHMITERPPMSSGSQQEINP